MSSIGEERALRPESGTEPGVQRTARVMDQKILARFESYLKFGEKVFGFLLGQGNVFDSTLDKDRTRVTCLGAKRNQSKVFIGRI